MNEYFPYKHWILTLSIAPLLLLAFSLSKGEGTDFSFWVFIPTILALIAISIVISTPAFIFYYMLFCFLSYKATKALTAKTILILFSIFTIVITITLFGGTLYTEQALYAVSSIVSGFFLNIQKRKILMPGNQEPV